MAMVLLEGNADRGIIVLANWSLYLKIPCVHQLGLFLMDPPLLSALVAMVLWPAVGVGKSRLEWKRQ